MDRSLNEGRSTALHSGRGRELCDRQGRLARHRWSPRWHGGRYRASIRDSRLLYHHEDVCALSTLCRTLRSSCTASAEITRSKVAAQGVTPPSTWQGQLTVDSHYRVLTPRAQSSVTSGRKRVSAASTRASMRSPSASAQTGALAWALLASCVTAHERFMSLTLIA